MCCPLLCIHSLTALFLFEEDDEDADRPDQLHEAPVTIMPNAECDFMWDDDFREDVQICTTSPDLSKGACHVRTHMRREAFTYACMHVRTNENIRKR